MIDVLAEMERFLGWFNQSPQLDNTLRACLAHLWFETLHPFEDGNGRIGRAWLTLAHRVWCTIRPGADRQNAPLFTYLSTGFCQYSTRCERWKTRVGE